VVLGSNSLGFSRNYCKLNPKSSYTTPSFPNRPLETTKLWRFRTSDQGWVSISSFRSQAAPRKKLS